MSHNFEDSFNDEDSFLDAVFEKIIEDQNTESSLFHTAQHLTTKGDDIEQGYPLPIHISMKDEDIYRMEKKEASKLDVDSPQIQRKKSEDVPPSSVDRAARRTLSVPGAFHVAGLGNGLNEESLEALAPQQTEEQQPNNNSSEILLDAELVDDDIESSRRNSILTVQASVVKEDTQSAGDSSFKQLFLKNRRFQMVFAFLMVIVIALAVGVVYGSRTSSVEIEMDSSDSAMPSSIINHTPLTPPKSETRDDASQDTPSQVIKPSPEPEVESTDAPVSAPPAEDETDEHDETEKHSSD